MLSKCRKCRFRDPNSKWDFKPIYFVQKCPQNAGNAVSETQISKHFRGACSRTPLQLCRHYGLPLTKIMATPLSGEINIPLFLQRPASEPKTSRFPHQLIRHPKKTKHV